MRTVLLISSAMVAVSGAAVAQTSYFPAEPVFEATCQRYLGRDLPVEVALASLVGSDPQNLSPEFLQSYTATLRGDATGPTLVNWSGGGNFRWFSVLQGIYALPYDEELRQRTSDVQITRRRGRHNLDDWRDAYLQGQLGLFTVHCPLPPADQPRAEQPRRPIITGDVAGLSTVGLNDRSFARLSYTNDRDAHTESFNVDVVLGLGVFDLGSSQVVPYVSYERESLSAAPVNDLTFGATGFWHRNYHAVRWNAAYETDDQFESSVWLADIEWEPPPFRGCIHHIGSSGITRCEYSLRADYFQVEDAGDKTPLLNADSYFRAGGRVLFTYGQPLWSGWLEAALRYELMEPLGSDEGDAARGEASLTLSPGETSNYEFGISYVNGEDITSLVRSETIKVFLGVLY